MSEEKEMLVVTSKIKNYIKANGDLKSSKEGLAILNDKVTAMCDAAIAKAKGDKNKTVLGKHFE